MEHRSPAKYPYTSQHWCFPRQTPEKANPANKSSPKPLSLRRHSGSGNNAAGKRQSAKQWTTPSGPSKQKRLSTLYTVLCHSLGFQCSFARSQARHFRHEMGCGWELESRGCSPGSLHIGACYGFGELLHSFGTCFVPRRPIILQHGQYGLYDVDDEQKTFVASPHQQSHSIH